MIEGMENTDRMLEEEIDKWTARLEPALETAEAIDSNGQELLDNAGAYLKDSKHFREKRDLVRAFEAIVWAWANVEIGQNLSLIEKEEK